MLTGILSVAGSAILFGIMPTLQKQLVSDGLSINSLLFFSNWTVTVICCLLLFIRRFSPKADKIQIIQGLLMGASGILLTAVLLNISYIYLPVGTATMLHFLYQAVVCIIMGIVFKAGFTRLQLSAVFSSFAGMICLTGAGAGLNIRGVVPAVASAFTYGIYLVANEKGPANFLPVEVKLFYVSLPGTAAFSVIALTSGEITLPEGGLPSWIMLIGGCGCITVFGYLLTMYGIERTGATVAAFVAMFEPLTSAVVSTVWFHTPVTAGMIVGSILIFLGIFLIALTSYKNHRIKLSKRRYNTHG